MTLANHLINHETGELDWNAIGECAVLRACREYGGPNPPPAYRRPAAQWCIERARALRTSWLDQRGLPRDEPTTLVEMPSWGASGDSFTGER
jgi:hypothetical protein